MGLPRFELRKRSGVAQWAPKRGVPDGHLVGRAARWSACGDVARSELDVKVERRSLLDRAAWVRSGRGERSK